MSYDPAKITHSTFAFDWHACTKQALIYPEPSGLASTLDGRHGRVCTKRRALRCHSPSLRPELGGKPASRKAGKLSCVRFGSACYSVPSKLIGATVLITLDGSTIRILEPFTGEVAAEHQLVAPGEVSITDEHYGSARPDRPRRAPRARTAEEKQFLGLGDAAVAFLAGAAAAGVSTLAREISQILTLQAAHGDTALVAARNERWSSAGGGPTMSARSWPRRAPPRRHARPARRWCSLCRRCRSGHCRTMRSAPTAAGVVVTGEHDTAAARR
jgi:hypothetical protein